MFWVSSDAGELAVFVVVLYSPKRVIHQSLKFDTFNDFSNHFVTRIWEPFWKLILRLEIFS